MIIGTFFSANFFANVSLYTTSLMSFSFAFASTVQEFAGSCIYLFIKHPYDVGDRVIISGTELIVEHICLLYTIFKRGDNNQTVQIPNIVSNGNWVENLSRSGNLRQSIAVKVCPGTAFEDLEALKADLEQFVRAPENSRDFMPEIKVDVFNVGDMGALELKVCVQHKVCQLSQSQKIYLYFHD